MPSDEKLGVDTNRAEVLFHAITAAADHANVGVVITALGSADFRIDIVYMNEAIERLLGWPRDEVVSKGVWSFVAPEELPVLQGLYTARTRGDTLPSTFETTLVHRAGHRMRVEISLGRTELDGRPAAVTFIVDISDRKAALAALERSQELFQQVITSAPDGIFVLRWPKIVFANPAGAKILDAEGPEQVTGLDITQRMVEDEAVVAQQRITRMGDGERARTPRQYRGKNPNGREFWVEISSIPIYYEGAPAVLAFARDVSERNRLLTKLVTADKLAAVNSLAAGVAHEINNPLAYVLLNLEFLARELRDLQTDPERLESMRRRIMDTRQGAERVKAIVRDLQALTRKDENIRGPIELDQVLENAMQMARHEVRPRTRVETSFDAVPCVVGNSTRLEQMFFNLLVNAAHSLPTEQLERNLIKVSLGPGAAGHVLVTISDNGCGMPADVLSRAFEPFFTTKPLGVGAGLGLPIAKRIIDDLGGSITLQSQLGLGTTVQVSLREHGVDVPHAAEEDLASRLPLPDPKRRGRVLVVDDERAVAESLYFALRDEHDVDLAGNGAAARAAMDSGKDYDVVLCDLVMPMESGMDLHAYAQQKYPELAGRFVFMTGGAFTPRATAFLAELTSPRIEKPFELEILRELIDEMVASRDSRESA